MAMVDKLSEQDISVLTTIVREALDSQENHGPEVAVAVLDQIGAILTGRGSDA